MSPGADGGTEQDRLLAAAIAGGDRDAFRAVFDQVGGAIKTTAWRVLRDETLADDVVQEVLVGLWRNPNGFDPARGTLRTYLLTLAHRRAVDIVRSEQSRTLRESRETWLPPGDIDEEVWERNMASEVRQAVAQLDEDERNAIAMAYFEGLSYVEVARRLEAPEGTVKSRIRSAMRKLSVSLEDLRQT